MSADLRYNALISDYRVVRDTETGYLIYATVEIIEFSHPKVRVTNRFDIRYTIYRVDRAASALLEHGMKTLIEGVICNHFAQQYGSREVNCKSFVISEGRVGADPYLSNMDKDELAESRFDVHVMKLYPESVHPEDELYFAKLMQTVEECKSDLPAYYEKNPRDTIEDAGMRR